MESWKEVQEFPGAPQARCLLFPRICCVKIMYDSLYLLLLPHLTRAVVQCCCQCQHWLRVSAVLVWSQPPARCSSLLSPLPLQLPSWITSASALSRSAYTLSRQEVEHITRWSWSGGRPRSCVERSNCLPAASHEQNDSLPLGDL